jgi:hypothetical protein
MDRRRFGFYSCGWQASCYEGIVWHHAYFLSEWGSRYVGFVARVARQVAARGEVKSQPCLSKVSFGLWVAT